MVSNTTGTKSKNNIYPLTTLWWDGKTTYFARTVVSKDWKRKEIGEDRSTPHETILPWVPLHTSHLIRKVWYCIQNKIWLNCKICCIIPSYNDTGDSWQLWWVWLTHPQPFLCSWRVAGMNHGSQTPLPPPALPTFDILLLLGTEYCLNCERKIGR